MSENGEEPTVSPQLVGDRLRWQPVTGDAILVRSRFDWTALARLIILAAAALVAFLALEWQTGVYEYAAHNAEAILVRQAQVSQAPAADPDPLPTFGPDELATPPPNTASSPVLPPPRTELVHVVQPGETLDQIAVRYSVSVQELLDANPEIVDPDLILTGDIVRIFA